MTEGTGHDSDFDRLWTTISISRREYEAANFDVIRALVERAIQRLMDKAGEVWTTPGSLDAAGSSSL